MPINLPKGSIIGAGTVVPDDIPEDVLAYGFPAKVVRKIGEEDS